jgi:hypothetical protein
MTETTAKMARRLFSLPIDTATKTTYLTIRHKMICLKNAPFETGYDDQRQERCSSSEGL